MNYYDLIMDTFGRGGCLATGKKQAPGVSVLWVGHKDFADYSRDFVKMLEPADVARIDTMVDNATGCVVIDGGRWIDDLAEV